MPISLSEAVTALSSNDVWGPPTTTESLVEGVPYAPYSKSDRLGRMADWTTEGKDREARVRQQYNRNFRGMLIFIKRLTNPDLSRSRSTGLRRWHIFPFHSSAGG